MPLKCRTDCLDILQRHIFGHFSLQPEPTLRGTQNPHCIAHMCLDVLRFPKRKLLTIQVQVDTHPALAHPPVCTQLAQSLLFLPLFQLYPDWTSVPRRTPGTIRDSTDRKALADPGTSQLLRKSSCLRCILGRCPLRELRCGVRIIWTEFHLEEY